MSSARARWPLFLIAAPAAVAIWSGWVGLGELCGFGPVRLLPGITGWTLNTAITLPVGVEAYAAYALGAWMSPGTPSRAARFAKWSALGALAYGMAGQVIYHLLAAAHAAGAPWPVVVVVSCMPVAVLGLAAALTHLLRLPADAEPEPETVPAGVPVKRPMPSVREIQARRGCSKETAQKARAEVQLDRRTRGDAPAAVSTEGNGNGRQGQGRQAGRQRPRRQAHQDPGRGQQPEGRQGQVAAPDRGQGGAGTVPALAAPDAPAGSPPEAAPQPSPAGAHPTMNGSHGA